MQTTWEAESTWTSTLVKTFQLHTASFLARNVLRISLITSEIYKYVWCYRVSEYQNQHQMHSVPPSSGTYVQNTAITVLWSEIMPFVRSTLCLKTTHCAVGNNFVKSQPALCHFSYIFQLWTCEGTLEVSNNLTKLTRRYVYMSPSRRCARTHVHFYLVRLLPCCDSSARSYTNTPWATKTSAKCAFQQQKITKIG